MILDKNECQKIVNRVISILGKNINIINSEGIIIASGDKKRVNTFHRGAKMAASEKKEVIVEDKDLNSYEGCRKGVNLPIYYNDEVLGVVGITGEPSEVKGYGIIVKELVELMIQENERAKMELFQFRAVKNFAREIIKENVYEDESIFRTRAQLIGFLEKLPRVVIVADICSFATILDSYNEDSETMAQKLKQDIVNLIKSLTHSSDDIVFNLSEDRFVILKSLNKDLEEYCNDIQKLLKSELKLNMYMGIGSVCNDLKDYHKSYMQAHKVVNVGRKLHPERLIYIAKEYKVQLLLNTISYEQKHEFLNSFGDMFNNNNNRTDMDEMLNTIELYFENKMSIKNTAEAMFLHRNTVAYRINKFKNLYKIDVTDPYYCMLVYISWTLSKLE